MEEATSIDSLEIQDDKVENIQTAREIQELGESSTTENVTNVHNNIYDTVYDMSREKYLIIFNHSEFQKPKPSLFNKTKQLSDRVGTEFDVKRLTDVFENLLEHKVVVHNNLRYEEIIYELKKFTQADHSKTSSVSVAILSHGDYHGVVSAFDEFYELDDVFALFRNSDRTLLGKPKLFFVQACRGDQFEAGRVVEKDSSARIIIPSQADFLFLYSTVEGFVSFREREGSWMIQTLCDVIESDNALTMDILTIITRMNNRIAHEKLSYNPFKELIHLKKQMTECSFTLTKQLYFRPTQVSFISMANDQAKK